MPVGKWILLVLALAPTAVLQSANISADPIANGISFLFLAWCLHLLIDGPAMDKKNTAITLALVFLLANIKLNALPLLLLLVFIKRDQFPSKKWAVAFWTAIGLIVVGVAGGWNLIAWQSDAVRRGLEGVSPFTLLIENLSHPLNFIHGLLTYIWSTGAQVIKGWIASTGYNYWPVHPVVFPVWLLALVAAVIASTSEPKFPGRLRAGLVALFVLLTAGTFALRYILLESIDNPVSVSGRYFSAFSPLLFLGLAGWGKPVLAKIRWGGLAFGAAVAALVLFSYGQWMSYYEVCGSARMNGQSCVLPVYKNWAPQSDASIPLGADVEISQEFEPQCASIHALRIYSFSAGDTSPTASGNFTLIDERDGLILIQGSFAGLSPADNFIELKFASVSPVTNRRLSVQIQVETADAGFSLATSEVDQYRGSLSMQGEELPGDLLLKYVCDP